MLQTAAAFFKCLCVIVLKALIICVPQATENYFGMVLRNNVLYGVYKLNGQEYEMQTGPITKSDPEPATFDKVELHR